MANGTEREIKLAFPTVDAARHAIGRTGASLVRPRRRQHDCLLDWPDRRLSTAGTALRVRVEPSGAWLTFKGPVAAAPAFLAQSGISEMPGTEKASGRMKVREELESSIADAAIVLSLLERLGLEVWFRYEKDREEYACAEAIVALDDTPVGTFVEIEGEASAIIEVTTRLGRSPNEYIADSYRSLFTQYCRQHGIERTHMLFDQMVEG